VAKDLSDSPCSEKRDRPASVHAGTIPVELGEGENFLGDLGDAAFELRAMDVVTRHFAGLGVDVKDVSPNQPYDLRCRKGGEQIDVEVKGTTTRGETVPLTRGEVQHALTTYPRTALAVVRDLQLHDRGGAAPHATGGTLDVHQPWRPLDIDLKPLGYTYTDPAPS
jgi:hypothetical protein